MSVRRLLAAGAIAVAIVGAVTWWPAAPAPAPGRVAVARALGAMAGTEGYARAHAPVALEFPRDHGPHADFRTEWWYFTGNLRSREGRRFGYQLTFFRVALQPAPPPATASAWRAKDVYMAHLALTDVDAAGFQARERFSRAALDLAGARAEPFTVWLGDWKVGSGADSAFPWQLSARSGDIELQLTLDAGKPPVAQGERGLSRKSGEPGNASYYYSMPRLPTHGQVRIRGRSYAVSGSTWLDREWSTSALDPDQIGWDWFALQLADGRELMFYRLRRRDGGVDPFSAGALIHADGTTQALGAQAVAVAVDRHWRSPRTGTVYPARWRVAVASAGLALEVEPLLAAQELDLTVRYWEGAVGVRGSAAGRPVSGYGYVELTGYDETTAQLTRR